MFAMLTNYKLRISMIMITGFLIVSIITAIATYSIYQNTLLEYDTEANKIIKLYETNYKNIIKDLRYLKLIDFEKSDKEVLDEFREFSQIIYDKNRFINGLALVKQFRKEDIETQSKNIETLIDNKKITIFPLIDILENAKKAQEDDLYSVMVYRTPLVTITNLIGAELSSEHNRQVIIASMNFTDKHYLTAPVSLVNDKIKGFKYSSIIYYPLYKDQNDKFYKWFVTVPMTSQKVLNTFLKEYYSFNKFNIHIYDKSDNHEEEYLCICKNKKLKDSPQLEKYIIKTHTFHFANRDRKIIISVDEIFSFEKYWTVILGFTSGMFFLFGIGYYLVFKEQKELEIAALSKTDHLTKVYNRIYFDEQIEYSFEEFKRYDQSFSIILVDIDYFKNINDRFGHTKGDEVLIAITNILSASLRKIDMLARWGGEEFVILIPNTSLSQAMQVAEKLRAKIEKYSFCSHFDITCSFGVTEVLKEDTSVSLFKRVDKALYKAKDNGRNRVESL